MRIAIAALVAVLTGCASAPEYFQASHDQYRPVWVTWKYVDDVDTTCRIVGNVEPSREIVGCAKYSQQLGVCIIYTAKDTNTSVVGHEIRHCFEGKYHE